MDLPYRCWKCERVFYADGDRESFPTCTGYRGSRKLTGVGIETGEPIGEYLCGGFGTYAGLDGTERRFDYATAVSARLNEDHMWEQDGMFNPHAVPMRDTPAWDRYVAQGKIVKRGGKDVLYSHNRDEYNKTLRDLGYVNGVGDGDMSKQRQADQRDHRCQQ